MEGGVVLAGRCHDGEAALPFAVAADLLRSALSLCPELPARIPAHAAAMAGRLAPELAVAHRDTPPTIAADKVAGATGSMALNTTCAVMPSGRPASGRPGLTHPQAW